MTYTMGPKQIRIIQVLVLVIVIGVVIGAYLMLNQPEEAKDPSIVVTNWSTERLDSSVGTYVDDLGQVIIETWDGMEKSLVTLWGSEHGMMGKAIIVSCRIEFQADPGTTISADRVTLCPDTVAWGTTYGSVSAYISYEDKVLHNSKSSTIVTADATGHASMELIILNDEIHNELYFDGHPIKRST